ncbi:hypothetical protein JTB14_019132 [Gonioctena quinquepunctata]|nr:hypothetical protein JTB14_019132 [Gonioctena quinquepunctata]
MASEYYKCKEELSITYREKEQNEKKIFYDPHPSEFEVTRRNSVEDPKESKFSPTHSFENMVCILAEIWKRSQRINVFSNTFL